MTVDGLTTIPSAFDARETMDRAASAVTALGMAILARIDHAAAAAKAGLHLRPTEVLIFGNARAGTPLMQAVQTIGIDLPLKILVWEDEHGQIWLAYYEPGFLARRHGIDDGAAQAAGPMARALAAVARQAAAQISESP